jgi:hypothetical protein
MKQPLDPSFWLNQPIRQSFLWVLMLYLAPQVQAQIIQSEQGSIPAIRHPKEIESEKGDRRNDFQNRHLFNFSDSINFVTVDPVLQSHWGKAKGLEATSIWDNIRGARFRARIDGIWHIGGELLERQGIASPMLGFWATQRRIPGWGRSKLGRNNASNIEENAYYDVARARGWFGWSNESWFVDAGIDALHIGAGTNSAFVSARAAPSPYIRLARGAGNHRSTLWLTHWMSTERGPEGETAESLLNRSRVLFTMHSWQLDSRVLLQAIYSFVREKEASQARGLWSGWNEGDEYFAHRHWGGMEFQFTSSTNSKNPWVFYIQSALDFVPRLGQTNPSSRTSNTLTQLAGLKLEVQSFFFQIEYFKRKAAQCKDCFGLYSADGSFETLGPNRALLQNAGISIQSHWNEGFFATIRWTPTEKLALKIHTEANTHFAWTTPEITWEIQSIWPLSAFAAITTGFASPITENSRFSFWQLGVRSAIPSF